MTNKLVPLLPNGFTLEQWHPENEIFGASIRAFCLKMIKLTYGYDYRSDWHADLDSLLNGEASWYAPSKGGTMLALRNGSGEIVGTGGVYSMAFKPNLRPILADRYPDYDNVAQLVRTYVDPSHRGKQLSYMLVPILEMVAKLAGYSHLNLHCDLNATKLHAHWGRFGFIGFMQDSDASHFDKELKQAA